MMMPKRIQRSRAKGWRLPEGAVIVDRSTPWGNPFVVGRDGTEAECVARYERLLDGRIDYNRKLVSVAKQYACLRFAGDHILELRGRDLACWCPANKPCHADVLLRLANARRLTSLDAAAE